MKIIFMRMLTVLFAALLLAGILAQAAVPEQTVSATILFTHDTHSHFLPAPDENGGKTGGYTRLATAVYRERAAADGAVLTVDAGDFSMGTLFQTLFSVEASELRTLGMMGFDVTTLGNHEFDYRGDGLANMLRSAVARWNDSFPDAESLASGGESPLDNPLPQIVLGNYKPPQPGGEGYGETAQAVQDALNEYGVTEYTLIEKDGVRFAVFGIFGIESDAYAPMSGMVLETPIDAAKRIVAEINEKEEYDFLICLSHSGTSSDPKKSEDELLAKAVSEIDLIVSGHTHTTLAEPLMVGDVIIGSVGAYTDNLGVLKISKAADGSVQLDDYRFVPIDDTIEHDEFIFAWTEHLKELVGEEYLNDYGMSFDQQLATSPFAFTPINEFGAKQEEDSLGSLISDSYIYAVQLAEGGDYIPIDMAVVPAGVVRGSFPAGQISVADAFNVSSLGFGADGTPGYPLISVYLTGRELRDVFEVDASVAPLMSVAQLYASGMSYSFNPHRMIFDKVTDSRQILSDGSSIGAGTEVPIDDNRLYRVVTGLYSGQMLGAVNDESFGILSITPKDKDGNPVEDFEDHIIHDAQGKEVKEWYALASYLEYLEVVPDSYAGPQGRKNVLPSWNPVDLLKNPGAPTLIAAAIILLLILVIVLIVRAVVRRARRKSAAKAGK